MMAIDKSHVIDKEKKYTQYLTCWSVPLGFFFFFIVLAVMQSQNLPRILYFFFSKFFLKINYLSIVGIKPSLFFDVSFSFQVDNDFLGCSVGLLSERIRNNFTVLQ